MNEKNKTDMTCTELKLSPLWGLILITSEQFFTEHKQSQNAKSYILKNDNIKFNISV
jgi:hypothetical protein